MKIVSRIVIPLAASVIAAASAGCTAAVTNTNTSAVSNTSTTSNANTAPPKAAANNSNPNNVAVTLPLIDAMFAEENFASDLKSRVQLTDEQVAKLKNVAREATSKLREGDAGAQHQGTTAAARAQADEQIKAAVGPEKAQQLMAFVSERYSGTAAGGPALPPPTPINATP